MTQTAREIADKLGVPDDPETLGIIIAYGNARIEDAAKVADNFRDVMLNTDLQTEPLLWLDGAEHSARDIAAAIRSLAAKEPTP